MTGPPSISVILRQETQTETQFGADQPVLRPGVRRYVGAAAVPHRLVILCHTDVLSYAVGVVVAVETAQPQHNVMFVDAASDQPYDNSAVLNNGEGVPGDTPFPFHLASLARLIYSGPQLRPRQIEAVSR